MIRSRLGLKALVLSGLVLGLMAFGVSSIAQAEVGSKWMVNGTDITTNVLLPEVQVKEIELLPGTEERHAALLFTTKGGTAVKILCTGAKLINVKLKSEGSLTEGSVEFTTCHTYLNSVLTANCTPNTKGVPLVIKTNNGLGLIILHELANKTKDALTLIKPETGEVLATVELGEKCAIGEEVPVKGELVLKDCKIGVGACAESGFTTESVEHLVAEGPLTSLTALGQPATLDGTAILVLSGTGHTGLKWSGLPA